MDDLYELSNIENFIHKEFWLFGAGNNGIDFYKRIIFSGFKIGGFCDNDNRKWGKIVSGTDSFCISADEMVARCEADKDVIIIITTHIQDIFKQLLSVGVNENRIFSYWSILHLIKYSINNSFFSEQFASQWMEEEHVHDTILRARYYAYHSSINYIRDWRRIVEENPILVYQFGKVGSSSINKSLQNLGISVIQSHTLNCSPTFMVQEMKELYKLFSATCKTKEIKIINIVREPIQRDISNLFEIIDVPNLYMFENMTTNYTHSIVDALLNKVYHSREEILRLSPLEYHYGYKLRGLFGNIFQWYENEMEENFGVDIKQYNFHKEDGFGYIIKGNIQILLLTLEKLKKNLHRIDDFIGIKGFSLSTENQSLDKPYRYFYNNVCSSIVLPTAYIDRYYDCNQYMGHFYVKNDLDSYRKKWMR